MKKKLHTLLIISLLCLPALCVFTGCSIEAPDCGHINECTCTMRLNTEFFVMERSNWWVWNYGMERYECAFEFKALSQDVINYSLAQAYVFILENVDGKPVEFAKSLPFVQTFRVDENYTYTETISYDITPGMITFILQSSDLFYDVNNPPPLPPAYEFKFSWVID